MAPIETVATEAQQYPLIAATADVNDTSKTPQISIREYRPEDHAHVVTLFKDGMMFYTDPGRAQYQVWVDYVAHSFQEDLADIQDHYMREGSNFFIATAAIINGSQGQEQHQQEMIVGTLGIEKSVTEGVAELRRVSVKAAYRRFGIGKLLMCHATQWAKDHKYTKLILANAATQHLAHRFYESLGHTLTKTTVFCQEPYFELTHFEKEI